MTRWQNLIRQDKDEQMSFETQYMLVVCREHMPEAYLPFSKPDSNSDSSRNSSISPGR